MGNPARASQIKMEKTGFCWKCKEQKLPTDFEHWRKVCKKCRKKENRLYREKHKNRLNELFKNWLINHRQERKQYCKEWYKNNRVAHLKNKSKQRALLKKQFPWVIAWRNINCRLANSRSKVGTISKHKKNRTYRFIKNHLTKKDIEFLWFRDKADLMLKPSIHRKNNKEHYSLNNCEFLELNIHNRLKNA